MVKLRLEEVLKEKNRTKYWLSKQTGISQGNISRMCNNKTTSINFEVLGKILYYLECTPNDLFEIEKYDNQ